MPKAKPISLHPLNFDDAIKALIHVDPSSVGIEHKQRQRERNGVTKKAAKRPSQPRNQ